MIRYLKHSEINPEKWNQTVRNSLFSTIFAEYEMLDLLTGSDIWDALVQDDYEAVMPLPYRKKGVLKYVYTPFFIPQMGIFSEQELSPAEVEGFLSEVSNHFVLADIILNEKLDVDKRDMTFVSHSMSLQLPYNELYGRYSQNTKRNIKTAEKAECMITRQQESVSDIIQLFVRNKGGQSEVHFTDRDYQRLLQISNYLNERDLLEIYGVRTADNQLAAGALFVKDGKRRWFWFSGRENQLSHCMPMFNLLNEYIRDHAETDLMLDFNGSTNENVARLYHSFGGERYEIPFVRCYKNPFWRFALKRLGK